MKTIIKIAGSVLLQALFVTVMSASQTNVNDSSIVKPPVVKPPVVKPPVVKPPVDSGMIKTPGDSTIVNPPVVNPPKDSSTTSPGDSGVVKPPVIIPPKDSSVVKLPKDSILKPVFDSAWLIKTVPQTGSSICWQKYIGAACYTIFIDSLYKATTKDSSYILTGLPAKDCYITIKAVNAAGQIIAVYPALKYTNAALGIADWKSEEIRIWPNPVTDIINIGGVSETAVVEIMNLSGVKVSTGITLNSSFAVNDLASGIYLARIISDGKIHTFRIVKQ